MRGSFRLRSSGDKNNIVEPPFEDDEEEIEKVDEAFDEDSKEEDELREAIGIKEPPKQKTAPEQAVREEAAPQQVVRQEAAPAAGACTGGEGKRGSPD